jgi:hypothetical protein
LARMGQEEELRIRVDAVFEYQQKTSVSTEGITARLIAECETILREKKDRARAVDQAEVLQQHARLSEEWETGLRAKEDRARAAEQAAVLQRASDERRGEVVRPIGVRIRIAAMERRMQVYTLNPKPYPRNRNP